MSIRASICMIIAAAALMGCVTTSTPTAEQRAYCTRMAEQMGTATTHDHAAMKGMPANPMNMTHEQCQRILSSNS